MQVDDILRGDILHFQRRQFCQNSFVSFWIGIDFKREEFAPLGKKFFLFLRVDPF